MSIEQWKRNKIEKWNKNNERQCDVRGCKNFNISHITTIGFAICEECMSGVIDHTWCCGEVITG